MTATDIGTRHVLLLVDDEVEIRDLLADALHSERVRVLAAGSAAQALHHLEAGLDPCLALVDVRMPGISGVALAERIAREHPRVPVALMSAQWSYLEEAAPHVVATVRKPFDWDELERLVEEHCASSGHCAPA